MSIENQNDPVRKKIRRGFAAMPRERVQEIASRGGKNAHARGHAHQFSTEEAREAGRLGGKAVSADRDHMRSIGRKGGQARREEASTETN